MERKIILNHQEIEQKINRIAYQILEDNMSEQNIVIIGIAHRGFVLAEKIYKILKDISNKNIELIELRLNKSSLSTDVSLNIESVNSVVLIDDVLNTGKTLMYAVYILLQQNIKKLRTVTLVDRRHRLYPVKADYVGLTLSTTLEEHIEVEFDAQGDCAYLI